MELEKIPGLILLAWLIGSVLLMAGLVRKGRRLTAVLARRHPETYETLGRPQPGFFQSVRRRQFARFISSRAYENIDDPALSAQFEDYRKAEIRLLVAVLLSLVIVAVPVLMVTHGTWGRVSTTL